MKGKTVWGMVGCLMTAIMLLVSCSSSPAAPAASNGSTKGSTEQAKTQSSNAPATEAPKSGGVVNLYWSTDPIGFDGGKIAYYWAPSTRITGNVLMAGDWAKGPAGTNENQFIYGADERLTSKTGSLAESWQFVKPGDVIFKIRQGVHFALDLNNEASKLVNGREMTADDVVYSLTRETKLNTHTRQGSAHMVDNTTFKVLDKYSLEMNTPVEDEIWAFSDLIFTCVIQPKEVVDKYGSMDDWKVAVGTGPFMLADYVSGASLTFNKNTNYWEKDPIGPGKGNQLPYADGLKILIIPDPSTQQTAIRTAKVDQFAGLSNFTKDDYQTLMKTTPELQSKRYLANGTNLVFMRVDKPGPFQDIKVRQALTMAIDYKSMVDKLLAGDAEYPGFPTMSAPDFKSVYFPLSDASKTAQELFSYNPTKAKQLLADAGFPNGFTTNIIANSSGGTNIDQLAYYKDAWSKIGVTLNIQPLENAAYAGATGNLSYNEMMYGGSGSHGVYALELNFDGGTQWNGSQIKDAKAQKARTDMAAAYAAGDQAKADSIYVEFEKYAMEQAWMIPYPRTYNYTVWWPWLKNYHGELAVGDDTGLSWTKYVWIDQDLKKSMGH